MQGREPFERADLPLLGGLRGRASPTPHAGGGAADEVSDAAPLALHRVGISALARQVGISESYLTAQLNGARNLTPAVVEALREAIGIDAWRFACREVDTLAAAPAAP